MEEARAIAFKAAQEQREKLLARAREAEAAKAAAEAAEAGAAASPAPELAAAATTSVGAPQVCNLLGRIHVTPIKISLAYWMHLMAIARRGRHVMVMAC